jgi:hypothetical protein
MYLSQGTLAREEVIGMRRVEASSLVMPIGVCLRALISPMLLPGIIFPSVSKADAVLYTLSVDYNGIGTQGPGSTVNWSFQAPSLLTSGTTDITTLLSSSIGAGFGSCGAVTGVSFSPTTPGGRALASYAGNAVVSWSLGCGTGNSIFGTAQGFAQQPVSLGLFNAYDANAGTVIGTLSIADELALQGGPSSSPVFLDVPLVAQLTGTIGGDGTENYYAFLWSGGAFSVTAGITGTPNIGASYSFSEGAPGNCGDGGAAT